ncbi:hypothetical protein DL95DRAFT_462813 [Leptodontidium sp. 2 PMI_412]|nr:hypothetical protein DL95DRAFT_462813 [Leptodontidium sp. 2 PMI_412]
MKVPGDEAFFDFASFDQDFGNDLNFLFSESPATLDTPSVQQIENEALVAASQQWNQPAPFGVQNILDAVLPHDTLHAISRILGLEYEFSMQLSRVRVSRPNHFCPTNTGPVHVSQTLDTTYNVSVSTTSGAQNPPAIIDDARDAGSEELGFVDRHELGRTPASPPLKDTCGEPPPMAFALPAEFTFAHLDFSNDFARADLSHMHQQQQDSLDQCHPSIPDLDFCTPPKTPVAASSLSEINFIFESAPLPRYATKPGRRRLVDDLANVESRAVKDQGGACWKCRILRKKVKSSQYQQHHYRGWIFYPPESLAGQSRILPITLQIFGSPRPYFTCFLARVSPRPSIIFRATTPRNRVLIKDFDIMIYAPYRDRPDLGSTVLSKWHQVLEEEVATGTLDIYVCGR